MPYSVYILFSASIDRFYIGITSDVDARIVSHNKARKGWTVRGRPWQLVYEQAFPDRQTAQHYERWLKAQKSRKVIIDLVTGQLDLRDML